MTKKRQDIYESVTNSMIKQLEAGSVPWVQPWSRPEFNLPVSMPNNADTHKGYSGINILLLWIAAYETQRSTHTWLTYKQALKLGGHVRKGETGTTICYANSFTPKAEKLRALETGEDAQQAFCLKKYTVFNADQCEGLDASFFGHLEPLPDCETIPIAEKLIKATGADFSIGGDRAFYMPSADAVQVPPQAYYDEPINWYRTVLHELTHWTGHESRLDRNLKGEFGSKDYAREELVAEMGAAFLCAALGITPTVRHSDYIAHWLKVLKEDKKAIFRAASMASKASDYILNFTPQAKAQELQAEEAGGSPQILELAA